MKAVLFAALAGLFWGVGEVATKSVLHTHRVGPLTAIALRSTIALPVIWAAWLWMSRVMRSATEPAGFLSAGSSVWTKLILGSGLSAGALGMICFYTALSYGEVSRVKPIAFSLAPALAVILGWALLGEPLTARKVGAVALILAGVVLLSSR